MKIHQVGIGVIIKCINKDFDEFRSAKLTNGKCYSISDFDSFDIKISVDDDGVEDLWVSPECFELVENQTAEEYQRMKEKLDVIRLILAAGAETEAAKDFILGEIKSVVYDEHENET